MLGDEDEDEENEESKEKDTPKHNSIFKKIILAQVGFALVYYIAAVIIEYYLLSFDNLKDFIAYFVPHYGVWISMVVGLLILIIHEER